MFAGLHAGYNAVGHKRANGKPPPLFFRGSEALVAIQDVGASQPTKIKSNLLRMKLHTFERRDSTRSRPLTVSHKTKGSRALSAGFS